MDRKQDELDVLVVGAGFAGLHQLYHLRKLGYKVKVVETASGLGGIWHWQTYPGARVDTEVPIYEYSSEELWKDWTYSERYPARAEILKYFEYVDGKWDLSKDILFNTRVVSAKFDASTNKWHVHTQDGQVFTAKFLDLCVGFGAKPYEAPFEGMKDFKGVIHHSNNWPKGVTLSGKKVAVIGTGATGVQVIQDIGPKVDHLTVFQRTPNLALPMHNPKLTEAEQTIDKAKYPDQYKLRFECFGGFTYTQLTKKPFDDPPEVRQAFYEQLWSHGDFHFWLAGYEDCFMEEKANLDAYEFWCKKVRARLHSHLMQDKLAPIKPPHAFGTKRPSLEVSYYEVFNQANVDLIDVRSNPIDRFTPNGIRTEDGVVHECDVIVLATGYDSITGSLHQIDIVGSTGSSLKDKWTNGIRTYLGMTSAGFPNLFFIYSAHGPTSFSNGPSCIEAQGDWILKCIDHVCKSGKSRIDSTEHAEEKWSAKIRELFNFTLFSKTDSWYCGANIPGKLREPMSYIGGLPMYIQDCAVVAQKDYEGFTIE